MCIIVAKPMNVEMPDEETLHRCFAANPDGSGFMYSDGKVVRIRKGFMTFSAFLDALDAEIPEEERTETAIVMHFRIATHGGVQPQCCHPFPVTDDKDELRSVRTECRVGVAHNGVIQGRSTNSNWSDTMDFVAGVMAPLFRMNANFMRNSNAIDLLRSACGSKLAIIDNSGDLVTVGEFKEDDGVFYSNSSYLRSVYGYSSYGSLFSGKTYETAYSTKLGSGWSYNGLSAGYDARLDDDDDEYDEDIALLISHLPFDACRDCLNNEECALLEPYCNNEFDAEDVRDYYDEYGYDYDVLETVEVSAK